MPQHPRGRNERGQEQREQDNRAGSRRQNMSNDRNSRTEVQTSKRNDNRPYRSTILSSIDYDRNAE